MILTKSGQQHGNLAGSRPILISIFYHLLMPNTMQFSFLHPFKLDLRERDEHPVVAVHAIPHDTSEGSEFLDDALRMSDLILTPFEESIAAGSPASLL